ncbi:hypothetical protein [Solimicrobium silvestre]|uniref:hypothetical protein n=1 Tax=Solimicrobium silvestre TaxID=2099400 RepID=UPI001056F1B9|nr:hypothetical protein [Solimicrobium silvestre]
MEARSRRDHDDVERRVRVSRRHKKACAKTSDLESLLMEDFFRARLINTRRVGDKHSFSPSNSGSRHRHFRRLSDGSPASGSASGAMRLLETSA